MIKTSWNGSIAKILQQCPKNEIFPMDYADKEMLWSAAAVAIVLEKLARYLLDNGRMSIRKMAEVMDCCIEDITKDL